MRFTQFCVKKLRLFGFGDYCGFCFYSALGFRFSAKIKSGFRICYSIWRGVLWFALRKNFVATTSTTCTSSLILPAICYYHLRGLAVSYTPQYLTSITVGMRSDQHGMSMAYFGWLRLKGDRKQLFKSQFRFFDLVRFSPCSPKGRGEVKSACSVFFFFSEIGRAHV